MQSDDNNTEVTSSTVPLADGRTEQAPQVQSSASGTVVTPPQSDALRSDLELTLKTGDVLRDRFEVDRVLGEGGMGMVFLARDRQAESSNPWVALKLLSGSFSEHPMAFAALRREAMQSRQLNHPNIVNVYDFDRTDDHVYMVMEFMEGDSLEGFVEENAQGSALSEVWPIIKGSGAGLAYVHERGIIHADFKPSNVFLTVKEEVKVLDLGIARTIEENKSDSLTTRFDPEALGAMTPLYASCEMFEGLPPTPQDDLYALACVAYELLTGLHPYQRKTAVQARSEGLVVDRPGGLKQRQWKALKAGLSLTRAERPASVDLFLEGLSPESRNGRKWPWILATAGGLSAAGAIYFSSLSPTQEQLIRGVLDQNVARSDAIAPEERSRDWLKQAEFFYDRGAGALEKNQIGFATGQLSQSTSSSLVSYRLVLTRSENEALRREAAKGVLNIAGVYVATAERLANETGSYAEIAQILCEGMRAHRQTALPAFTALLEEQPDAVRDSPSCQALPELAR